MTDMEERPTKQFAVIMVFEDESVGHMVEHMRNEFRPARYFHYPYALIISADGKDTNVDMDPPLGMEEEYRDPTKAINNLIRNLREYRRLLVERGKV